MSARFVGGSRHGKVAPDVVYGTRIIAAIAYTYRLYGQDVYRLRRAHGREWWGFDGRCVMRMMNTPRHARRRIYKAAGGYA